MRLLSYYVILNTSEDTELTLYSYTELMSVINNLLCQCNVLLVWKSRTIDHYRREAEIYTALTCLEAITVIEVENDLRMVATQLLSILYSTLCQVTEQCRVSILTSTLRYLEDNW